MNAPQTDIRHQVSAEEWALRVDLAACYRLVALFGWDDLVFTHISARVPGPEHHFLINPYGFAFEEITASSLIKVDSHCRPVLPSEHPVNPAGFLIHSTVHEACEEVVCVMHTHTPAGVAVSAQRDGLLPISQQASVVMGALGYHDYEGIALRDEERPRLVADLGSNAYLILRNHGLLTVGASIPEAFLHMFTLQRACEIQVLAQAGGAPLISIDPEVLATARDFSRTATRGMGGAIAWPAALRRVQRPFPGFDV